MFSARILVDDIDSRALFSDRNKSFRVFDVFGRDGRLSDQYSIGVFSPIVYFRIVGQNSVE